MTDRTSPETETLDAVTALRNLLRRIDDHFCSRPEWDWKEQADARAVLAKSDLAPTPDLRARVALLAERFWSIHPKEIQDMGITRQQFYEREMLSLVASPDTSTDRASK